MKGICVCVWGGEIQENAVWRERENKMKAMAALVPKMRLQ